MEHHIKRLKRHRNILYFIVAMLLLLQIMTFVVISSKTSRIASQQEKIEDNLEKDFGGFRQEMVYNIGEITKKLGEQRSDINNEIDLLKASAGQDFSGLIDGVIPGVVNIRTDKSVGTGFIVTDAGYVVTNAHVLNGAEFVVVSTYLGQDYDAIVIGEDKFNDIALLKIAGVFDSISLGASDEVQTGEGVIAIGNPLGLAFTVTKGIVSATNRTGPNGKSKYVQTDVTLNPGNSGGPLINKMGKVIGMNNFKIGGAESLGFALEIDLVKRKINEIANQTIVE